MSDGGASVIRSCASCGQKNRVPVVHLARTGRCGACKAALPPLGEPLSVDGALFESIVKTVEVPVLVDFWAAWCGPCLRAAPEVEKTAKQLAGRAVVLKVDTEAEPGLAQAYQVRSIPHFMVFRGGVEQMQHSGLVDHRTMAGWLERSGA